MSKKIVLASAIIAASVQFAVAQNAQHCKCCKCDSVSKCGTGACDNDTLKADTVDAAKAAADSAAIAQKKVQLAAQKQKANENLAKLKVVLGNIVDSGAITAKVKLNLQFGSQTQKVNATLRMKRNESIQLMLLAPFIGTEIGRIEFTPDYFMVVDRFHGRYVQMAYSDVAFLKGANLDFYSVQALFWADVFAPGAKKATTANKFAMGNNNNQTYIKALNTGKMVLAFWASPSDGTLSQTKITQTGSRYQLNCKYQTYQKLDGGKNFPSAVCLAFSGDQNMTLDMTLGNFSNNSNWESKTTLSSKYEKLSTLEELFSGF